MSPKGMFGYHGRVRILTELEQVIRVSLQNGGVLGSITNLCCLQDWIPVESYPLSMKSRDTSARRTVDNLLGNIVPDSNVRATM